MHCCYYIAFAKIINSEPKKSVTHGRTDTYAPFAGLENIAPLKKKMAHPYTAQDKHCLLWYRTALHTIRGYNRIGQQRTLHFNQCKKINHKPFSSVFNVKPTLLNSRAFFRAYTQKPSVCSHSKKILLGSNGDSLTALLFQNGMPASRWFGQYHSEGLPCFTNQPL